MLKMTCSIFAIVCIFQSTLAGKGKNPDQDGTVEISKNATHIARISNDTIFVLSGSTYSFTVDTPEGEGLVSTGLDVSQIQSQLSSKNGSIQKYTVTGADGTVKQTGNFSEGDRLVVATKNTQNTKSYTIILKSMAVSGRLWLDREEMTINTNCDLSIFFTAGQRTPDASVRIYLPPGINATLENTTVNVIGRGEVKLKDLSTQSIGRVGSKYSYSKVGEVTIIRGSNGGSVLNLSHLDLRPANGPDLKIVISNVKLNRVGSYLIKAVYTTSQPEILSSAGTGSELVTLTVKSTITDLKRIVDKNLTYTELAHGYSTTSIAWSKGNNSDVQLLQSLDTGKTWKASNEKIDLVNARANISGLQPNKLYAFRILVKTGPNKGLSNTVQYYSGKLDLKTIGVEGNEKEDATDRINKAISFLESIGGGTLLFSKGTYSVRTVHLKTNVYLYLEKNAVIKAIKGADAPEATWFSDKKYRSGLSPTDTGPYENPDNWLTKQDVGHHYFRNAMFFGERLDNVKIIGNGRITGDGNLVTGDRVMNNTPDNRADKMFSLKLCTNIEIGGLYRKEDLWYDSARDEPYYIKPGKAKDPDVSNMLQIDRGGHFVLLATGTDNIHVHNTYFGKESSSNVRDIYDFMACNNVIVTNIYSKVSSDDIVKPGSDCSLGFTRPARNYKVRNVIGDTNCNLFQIGSETADDIMDIHVDNIYVLGANKAGFSISTNDGGHIKDIHLNCGHTGILHSRSKMFRSFAPFFISISNRGRVLGAEVGKYAFSDNGEKHNELLIKNINIGIVENIILNGIDVSEVYAGSSFSGNRWKAYDGSQRRATPIIAGYGLPSTEFVEGGLDFKLPNGKHTGYIKNVEFNDVNILVKGGNLLEDTTRVPPELGVGQYNASNLRVQPSYAIWARHVDGLTVTNCSFNYEKRDSRYAILLDDVVNASISSSTMVKPMDNESLLKLKNSSNVKIEKIIYYEDEWGRSPTQLIRVLAPLR